MFCQSQAYPTENKPEKSGFFWLIFSRIGLALVRLGFFISKKSQIGNPATQELRMRTKYARKLIFVLCIEVHKT